MIVFSKVGYLWWPSLISVTSSHYFGIETIHNGVHFLKIINCLFKYSFKLATVKTKSGFCTCQQDRETWTISSLERKDKQLPFYLHCCTILVSPTLAWLQLYLSNECTGKADITLCYKSNLLLIDSVQFPNPMVWLPEALKSTLQHYLH